jgi:heme-degrading monooxygenase HmoA
MEEVLTHYHLAQLNIAQLIAPIDSPQLSDFVDNLDRINALADEAPGFIWRLQTEEGDATGIDFFGTDKIVNLSLWDSVEALHNYVYRSAHIEIMRRKKEWFHKMGEAYMVLWWVPAGHTPSIEEAAHKLNVLRERGPTVEAFTFKKAFPVPADFANVPPDTWDGECPAT